jgi:hypothetical protein
MERTPTGESATPPVEGGEPAGAEGKDASVDPAVEERVDDRRAEHGVGPPALPVPRAGTHALPQRARTAGSRAAREPERREPPAQTPDGRPYRAPDEETLTRLLTGLRDI